MCFVNWRFRSFVQYTFVVSINVFDCRLSGMSRKYDIKRQILYAAITQNQLIQRRMAHFGIF